VLLTDVAERYFNVEQAQGEVASNAAEFDAVKKQLAEIQGKFDRQLAQITDLLQAQASAAAVDAQQIRLQSDLDLAREALRSVSGLDVGKLFDLEKGAGAPAVNDGIAAWVAKANDNNFQIKAKQHAIDAAEMGIERRRGAFMPQASLIVERQDSDVGFDNAPIRESETAYVGVDITIPIYMGGSRGANLREARSLHSISKSELDQIKLDTSELVRSACLQLKASESSIKAAKILVDSTTKTADAVQKGFDLGTVTNVDVLNAIRDQYMAERQLQKARYENIKFYLLLKREAGSLEASDMVEVSSWLSSTAGITKKQSDVLFASSILGY
jgi:outer membrane protein